MADTLTSVYKFTLPEIGQSEDTWGVKLNNNLAKIDTLLSQAFQGGNETNIGNLFADRLPDPIRGTLEHKQDGGYFRIGAYNAATYGTGNARTYYDANNKRIRFDSDNVGVIGDLGFLTAQWEIKANGSAKFGKALINQFLDGSPSTVHALFAAVDGAGSYYYSGVATGLPHIFRDKAGVNLAAVDLAGTALTAAYSLVTREKGDAQYIQSAGSTRVLKTSQQTIDGRLNIIGSSGGVIARFYDTSSAIKLTIFDDGSITSLGNVSAVNIAATADISAADKVTGRLIHDMHRGYMDISSYSSSYGTGLCRVWWNNNAEILTLQNAGGQLVTLHANVDASDLVQGAGAVGTYRWLLSDGGGMVSGTTYTGSNLRSPIFKVNISTTNLDVAYGSGPSGSWKAMQSISCAAGEMVTGLFLRTI